MKNKFLITGLATATLLSTAALTQLSPSVYAAESTNAQPSATEKEKQDEILANFDKALAETIKELEEEAKNDPDSAESIKETIAKLKEEAAKERAKIEDGFKTGKTAEATEKEIEEIAKKEEAAEKAEAEAEEAAQKEFLANFDKALEDAIAELKKADTQNDPELAKQVAEAITKLKEEAAKQKKEIEDGFKKGLTVEEAEKAIDDANKKAAEEAEAEAKAKQDEFLANYDKALEEAVKELEKAETNSPEEAKAKADTIAALKAASDATRKQIVEGFEKGLTVEEAEKLIDELNKKAAEEDKEAAAKEKAAQDEFLANYDKALEQAVKELEKAETNSPEEAKAKADTIAALKAASDETRKQIVEGFKKGLTAKQAEAFIDELNKKAAEEDKEKANKPAEQPKSEKGEALVQEELLAYPEIKKVLAEIEQVKNQLKADGNNAELKSRLAALEEALDILSKNLPAVNEVPEFDLSTLETATGTQTQASARQPAQAANEQAQEAPSTKNPAGINPRTSANSAQAATEEKTAVAQAAAEAPKAEESKQAELPNTGSAEFAVFTPAVLSILAGLGLVAPKGKKEDK